MKKIAIIGAGPAGMTAAGFLHRAGIDPDVYEHSERPGRKLGITGKGRCNLTNNCPASEVIANIPTNPRFLYGAVNSFTPADTMELFESLGVPLKTERGNRVFPVSDKARDIVDALVRFMGVKPIKEEVSGVAVRGEGFSVKTDKAEREYETVLIATGGRSYPSTGSTGDGYRFARELGHTVTPVYPSLIPLTAAGDECRRMMGLSLKNVAVSVTDKTSGRTIYEDFGEMMFTHFGITGPVVLSASSHMRKIEPGMWRFDIDLKPALDREKLDRRLLSDFEKYRNKDLRNGLSDLLPKAMISVFIDKCGIAPEKKINSITRAERQTILDTLKRFSVDITGTRPIEEAIITSGGVSVKEIDPKTMRSKIVKGLYFAGEVIDVDAYTGGFNLQIAFSTAVSAARAIIDNTEVQK
ncbi:MAG: NAD(P)/FAD-dependent oxidoreductase [Clostridia bacterium]|nr:NAD(P)/FAD-dependent oxidoreductase [Clostridia bacterium]